MTTKSVDLNFCHLKPADRIGGLADNARWELEAAEELLDNLHKELQAIGEMRGFDLTGTLTFSPITHLVTLARIRTEKMEEACGELPPSSVQSIKSAAE